MDKIRIRLFTAALFALSAHLPGWADTSCSSSTDTCQGDHSSLFAIAHDYKNPNNLLFRVKLPEQSTTTSWGDGRNGFVYQVEVNSAGEWETFVPFNGISNGADGVPMLRPFSFIVEVPKPQSGTETISVRACALLSFGDSEPTECTSENALWTDTYSTLPAPTVATDNVAPANLPSGFSLEFDAETIYLHNNGVYGVAVTLKPLKGNGDQDGLTQDQIDWLYDHIVFLDENNDVFTNNLFPDESSATKSIGVLPLEEAGYPTTPGGSEYLVKYTESATAVSPTVPGDQAVLKYWIYSADPTASTDTGLEIQAGWLFDASTKCPGALSDDTNSSAHSCPTDQSLEAGNLPYADLYLFSSDKVSAKATPDNQVGTQTVRNITFDVSDGGQGLCSHAVNPLAAFSKAGVNLPNYVLDTTLANDDWNFATTPALYYVTAAGYGNCQAENMPFCSRVTASESYAAYIPHYLDTSGTGGSLNGGGTAARLVESFNLADRYHLAGLSTPENNYIPYFDNCGYGHVFHEEVAGSRDGLPTPPFSLPDSYPYEFDSAGTQALVVTKDCCASFYQASQCTGTDSDGNPTGCTYSPPEQIGQGFGMFLPQRGAPSNPAINVGYQTIFPAEAFTVYAAASGEELYRFVTRDKDYPQIQSCASVNVSLTLSPYSEEGATRRLSLYDDGTSGPTKCTGAPQCPYGMTATPIIHDSNLLRACVASSSQFLMNLDIWASQDIVANADGVVVTAWGSDGVKGNQGTPIRDEPGYAGGSAGKGGYAQTVLKPSDLAKNLYAYIPVPYPDSAKINEDNLYMHGGPSTVVSTVPLSSQDPKNWTDGASIDDGRILLIGGGGGGGGNGSNYGTDPADQGGNGGNGGAAIANSTNPESAEPVSASGTAGNYKSDQETGGHPGNPHGGGTGGSSSAGSGVGGFSGSGEKWSHTGSLIPPSTWAAGAGASGTAGGGGGFGGGGSGGSPHSWVSGGGGGGSWAAANTAHVKTGIDPSQIVFNNGAGAVVFSIDSSSSCSGDCMKAGQVSLGGTLSGSCVDTSKVGTLIASSEAYVDWSSSGDLELWKTGGQDLLWSAGQDNAGGSLCFNSDGTLTIQDADGHTVFDTDSTGGTYLMLNGCSMEIIDGDNGEILWSENQSC